MKQQIIMFLRDHDAASLPTGEIEINGRDLFVRPAEYRTKPASEGKFETHRVYADLQYVVRGHELMQTASSDGLSALTEYDIAGDYQFWRCLIDPSSFIVRAGEFAFFWPGEAHRPSCSPSAGAQDVKKLVFKIRI